ATGRCSTCSAITTAWGPRWAARSRPRCSVRGGVADSVHHPRRRRAMKGLAERDVKADLALWQLRFVRAGDQLATVQAAIQQDDAAVTAFLTRQGLGPEAIAFRNLEVTDRAAQTWGDGKYPSRYIIVRTVMLRSADVDKV